MSENDIFTKLNLKTSDIRCETYNQGKKKIKNKFKN